MYGFCLCFFENRKFYVCTEKTLSYYKSYIGNKR